MTHAIETTAWANEVPWHGLGFKVEGNLTPAQMCKAAQVDWTVSKRKMFFEAKDGKHVEAPNDFALVRDTDESHLSTVGSTWKEIQNATAFEFFDKWIKAGHMTMETAGSLWGGRYVWALARIGKDFAVGKDEIRSYLLLASPHVRGKAFLVMWTGVRVVCANTLTLALGPGLNGKSKDTFRMPHSVTFDDATKTKAEVALKLATEQTKAFQSASSILAKKKAKPEDTYDYFCQVLRFDPKKAEKKKDGEIKVPRMLPKFQQALEHAPGHNLNQGTWWSNLNAVTYVIDHESGRDKSTALKNAWLGHLANVKRKALDLALANCK